MPATAGAAPASARGRETAGIGQGVEMVVGIAEQRVDRGQSLERMADLIFGRYPDRTVKLDGLLAAEPAATPDLNLGRGDVAPALLRRLRPFQPREDRPAARLDRQRVV